MRRQHWLKANANVESPRFAVFVDTEAHRTPDANGNEWQTLWFGYAQFWRRRTEKGSEWQKVSDILFTDARVFWNWLSNMTCAKWKIWVFAHNWQYDAAILNLERVPEWFDAECVRFNVDSGRFIIDFRSNGATWAIRDSGNYLQGSLASIGASIGAPKLTMPDDDTSIQTWLEYCVNDVNVLSTAMRQFIDFVRENDLGNFRNTLAAQAFGAYRHRFMQAPILIHDRQSTLDLERRAYHGGRVEAFRLGKIDGPVTILDVNSLYPFMMRIHQYPVSIYATMFRPTIAAVREKMRKYCVIADCEVETNEPVYARTVDGKLCFPIGRFATSLTTPEIGYAIARGHLISISRAVLYRRARIFKTYVDWFYAARQKYRQAGNDSFAYASKLFLNSLYGKFGEKSEHWEMTAWNEPIPDGVNEWVAPAPKSKRATRYRQLFGKVFYLAPPEESYDSAPGIAAHVTAYARLYLWRLMLRAGRENCYYTDTDSLMVNDCGANRLAGRIDGARLGALKRELVANAVDIRGPKDYTALPRHKVKGIRANATLIASDTYRQQQFGKWSTQLMRGLSGGIMVRQVVKHLERRYTKGNVQPDGTIEPYRLG